MISSSPNSNFLQPHHHLTREKEILKDELDLMNESRERLRTRLNQCEENVRSLKEQLNATKDQSVVEVVGDGGL